MLVMISALLLFHNYLLRVPSELVPLGPYFMIGVAIPMILRWLSGAQSPIRRWSVPLFIVSVYLDIAALMTARIVCIQHGYDVLPIIVPIAVLASLLMVQIRITVLAPAVTLGFAGIAVSELVFLPVDSNMLFNLTAAAAIVLVPLASAWELERVTRTAWQHALRLQTLSRTDALTGLPNRRALEQSFAELVSTAATPLIVAIIDVDGFKKINDRHGHTVGDECLRSIARYLTVHTDPRHEYLARLSGEEFVIVWHGISPEQARRRLDRVRLGIAALDLPTGRPPGGSGLTVSGGMAVLDESCAGPAATWTALLHAADGALYEAKRSGRDRTASAGQTVRVPAGATAPTQPAPGPDDDPAHRLQSTFWSLRLPADMESRFRTNFDDQGIPARRMVMAGLLVVCVLILAFQSSLLQIPPEADRFGRLCLIFGIMPPAAIALAVTFSDRLRPRSAHIYLGCIAVIIGVQMFQRVIQLPKGYDVVPWLMPVAVLLSVCVVQIRYSMLLPAVSALLAGVIAAEMLVFPLTGNRFLLIATMIVMAGVTVRFSYRVEQMQRLDWLHTRQLTELSRTDPMTGLPNRRQFVADLDAALASARSSPGEPRARALILIDLDRLKAFNDRYGHLAGDACIRRVGQCLAAQCLPGRDTVARLGGEEFALILHDLTAERVAARARRLVSEVAALGIQAPDGVVTISAGLTVLSGSDTADATMQRADHALYHAKNRGRNRLVIDRGDAGEGGVTESVAAAH